jgi:hypothetical protein
MVDMDSVKRMTTLGGRLSFHQFTAEGAHAEALEGPYSKNVKGVDSVSPYANLLLTQGQYDRLLKRANEFLDACEEQYKKNGEKADQALKPDLVKLLRDELENMTGMLNTPFKKPSEKTLELMPDCAMVVKILGFKGKDIELEAKVEDESQLAVPDPDRIKYPVVLELDKTNREFYNGCWVVAKKLKFYRYMNGKNPGFSLGFEAIVLTDDDAPFSGGAPVDDDDVFAEAAIR